MADPVTAGLMAVSTATQVAGGLFGAQGAQEQAQAQANAANYQAAVAQINAKLAANQATYDLAQGQVQAEQAGMRTGQEISSTKAAYASGNVAGPTTEKVVKSEEEAGAQTQGIIQANAAERAYGEEVTSMQDTAQSQIFKSAAKQDIVAGDIGATSSILGAAGGVASKWLQAAPAFTRTAGANPTNDANPGAGIGT